MRNPFWTEKVPIWVSRENASGQISQFEVSGWIFLLVFVLILFNAILWGGYGIYEWVRLVV